MKSIENKLMAPITRRGFLRGAARTAGGIILLSSGASALISCGSSGGGNPGKKNKAPTIDIGESFGDGLSGKVTYLLSASDPDGSVKNVYAKSNGNGNFLRLENGEIIQYDIEPGNNTVEAYAVDNEGKTSQTATRSFYSPVDEDLEVDPIIEGILEDRGYTEDFSGLPGTYYKDALLSTGFGTVTIDYLITPFSGPKTVFEYVGHSDDLQAKIDEKDILDQGGNPNLYLARCPFSLVESQFTSFADNNL